MFVRLRMNLGFLNNICLPEMLFARLSIGDVSVKNKTMAEAGGGCQSDGAFHKVRTFAFPRPTIRQSCRNHTIRFGIGIRYIERRRLTNNRTSDVVRILHTNCATNDEDISDNSAYRLFGIM